MPAWGGGGCHLLTSRLQVSLQLLHQPATSANSIPHLACTVLLPLPSLLAPSAPVRPARAPQPPHACPLALACREGHQISSLHLHRLPSVWSDRHTALDHVRCLVLTAHSSMMDEWMGTGGSQAECSHQRQAGSAWARYSTARLSSNKQTLSSRHTRQASGYRQADTGRHTRAGNGRQQTGSGPVGPGEAGHIATPSRPRLDAQILRQPVVRKAEGDGSGAGMMAGLVRRAGRQAGQSCVRSCSLQSCRPA